MEFKKYSSIENSYVKSSVEQVYLHGYQEEDFVVQEKIHGANFSFWVSDQEIRCAKRTAFLEDNDNFYGWQEVLDDWKQNLIHLRDFAENYALKNFREEFHQMVLFGELFGGHYKHPDVPNSSQKQLQKGIIYHPEIKFIPFDMYINGKLINLMQLQERMIALNIVHVPNLLEGTFQECMNYSNEFPSKIHELYGLPAPDVESNICEGTVIKSVEPLFFRNGQRVIFKNKNDKWTEKAQYKKNQQSKQPVELNIPPIFAEKINELINENRVAAVVSKIGEPRMEIMGKVLKEFNLDVIEECKTLGYFNGLEKEQIKAIQKAISRDAPSLVKKYLIENHV